MLAMTVWTVLPPEVIYDDLGDFNACFLNNSTAIVCWQGARFKKQPWSKRPRSYYWVTAV
jgi:hypothetical protein